MRKLFRNKIFIIFLILFVGVGGGLIWGAFQTEKTMGLKVNIPEIDAKQIIKSVHYDKDSLVQETVTIVSNLNQGFSEYIIVKFRNSGKKINELLTNEKFKPHSSSPKNVFGVDVWNYHKQADKIDFKYNYTIPPVTQKEFGDTVLIQFFDKKDEKIEISLTKENKKDLELKIKQNLPPTIVLYKRDTYLYLMVVYRIYDQENKWVTQQELEKTLYPLIKNWGVFEKK